VPVRYNNGVQEASRTLLGLLAASLLVMAPLAAGAASPAIPAAGVATPRPSSLRALVERVSREHGLDPRLVLALVRVESGFNPRAISPRGALGLMQIMPATARRLRLEHPFDPEENVRAGVRELGRLIERYVGDLPRALAAYNAGEGAVDRYGGVPPYRETRGYVSRIMTLYTGRPYHLPGAGRRPVRLVRDRATGEAVITNLGAAAQGGAAAPAARGGILSGGFGR